MWRPLGNCPVCPPPLKSGPDCLLCIYVYFYIVFYFIDIISSPAFIGRAFSSLDICSFIFLHRVCRPSVNHSPPLTAPAILVILRNGGSVAEWLACRLTAKNQDQLRNPIRSVIEYGLPLPFLHGGVLTSNIAFLIFALSAGKILQLLPSLQY